MPINIKLEDKRPGNSGSSATTTLVTTMLPRILEKQPVKDAFKSLFKNPGAGWSQQLESIISNLTVEIRPLENDQTYTHSDKCLFLNSRFADELDSSQKILSSGGSRYAIAVAKVSKFQYEFLVIASFLNELGHYVYLHLANSKAHAGLVSISDQQFQLVANTISLVEQRPIELPDITEEEAENMNATQHPATTVLDPGQVVVVQVFSVVPEFEVDRVGVISLYIFRHSTGLKNIDMTPMYASTLFEHILSRLPTIAEVPVGKLKRYNDEVVRYRSYKDRRVGLSVLNRTLAGTFPT